MQTAWRHASRTERFADAKSAREAMATFDRDNTADNGVARSILSAESSGGGKLVELKAG